jgi:hypothetical protein
MQPQALQRRDNISANKTKRIIFGIFSVLYIVSSNASSVYANTGNMSGTRKYAWSNVGGWVNFAPTNSGVTVTGTAITGYAWSANDGWINLSPSQSGVKNDGVRSLGYAWDSVAGRVNFSGVKIDASGNFSGQATGANGYAINFDCASCAVQTSWGYSSGGSSVVPPSIVTPPPVIPPQGAEPPPGVVPLR